MAKHIKRQIRVDGDLAYIPLTQGYEAIIDAADVPLVKPKPKGRGAPKGHTKKPSVDRREVFIRKYLELGNATRAYVAAGYKDGSGVRQSAHAMMISPYVRDRLADQREIALAKLDVRVDDVFDRFKAIAFGDAAALTEYQVGACRYCHSTEHRYHWRTHREFSDAMEAYMLKGDAYHANHTPPDDEGGYGYRFNELPHPDCPECEGDGITRTRFKSTSLMTPDERKLFAGVKETQHGIEFRMHDQMGALKELAEHLQFYKERDETNANAVARLIGELRERGSIQRMPLRKDKPEGDTE